MLPVSWIEHTFPDITNVSPVGPGGQKFVYSGTHSADGDVVLKIIHPHVDQATVDREIHAVDRVQSARVPRIFATGVVTTPVGDCIWIREQRISGESLRERLVNQPLDARETLRLAVQMLEALADAERVQIVHRDVKPENIIIDAAGDFWLIDFGIARHLTMKSLTADALVFGKFTLGYAPREQLRNEKAEIDGRADLFGLGVTLIESATGVHPFRHGARDNMGIWRRSENDPAPRLSLGLIASDSFADLVDVMTKKRRDQRCANVQDALDWVREVDAKEINP